MKTYKIAIVGNQNCGKTTLFNVLTKSNQHIGNFPGVTVEKKSGYLQGFPNIEIVDLPGIYAFNPFSQEEIITRKEVLQKDIDLVINVVDATNLERNLYLTIQLLEMNVKLVVAANMMDELHSGNNQLDTDLLATLLKRPVVGISANKAEHVDVLIQTILEQLDHDMPFFEYDNQFELPQIHEVEKCIQQDHGYFKSIKILENDDLIFKENTFDDSTLKAIDEIKKQIELQYQQDSQSMIVKMRFDVIEHFVKQVYIKKHATKGEMQTKKIDGLLLDRLLAIPTFLCIMFLIFYLSFNVFGPILSDVTNAGIEWFIFQASEWFIRLNVHEILYGLVIDGALAGIGSVLGFLPIVIVLFFFLSLLEDTGYMARIAFIMDAPLSKIGLSGKSLVPLLLGFGCSVPAILSTRTITSKMERFKTILLVPFMSCSAKIPVYATIISLLFVENQALIMFGLYLMGILVAILVAALLKPYMKDAHQSFVLELPVYRFPTMRNVYLNVKDKAMDFIQKAFTIIFIGSMVIWMLTNFNFALQLTSVPEESILGVIASNLTWIFTPIGLDDWRFVAALISGVSAKESVVSTLEIVSGNHIASLFTPLKAMSFLVFTLLYFPCFAAFAAINKELHSFKKALCFTGFQTLVAYVVAFLVYQIGGLL